MVRSTQFVRFTVFAIFSLIVLASCGGGGSSSPDTTPDSFSFNVVADPQPVNTSVTSSAPTISGLNAAATLTINGGEYSINGGDFNDEDTTITNNQTIAVRVQTSPDFSTATSVTVTIGGIASEFEVTTEAEDTTPGVFDLGASADSNVPQAYAESSPITITEINSPAAISIANGEFKIVGVTEYGDTQPVTVALNQQVQVRVRSSAQHGVTETATLTIDTLSDTFAVTTADDTAPAAEVVFPTQNTLSDGDTVTLRGTATDDFGPVSSIQVVVTTDSGATEVANETITVEGDEDYQDTWSVQVGLAADAVNTIQVTATDVAGNPQSTPTEITVTQTTTPNETAFPLEDTSVLFTNNNLRGIAWDRSEDRNRLLIATSVEEVISVDVSTGERSVLVDTDNEITGLGMIYILEEQNKILFGDQGGVLHIADIDGSNLQPLSNSSSSNSDASIVAPFGMVQDSLGVLYVIDAGGSFYTVDIETGARSLISDSATPAGGANPFTTPTSLILDREESRALITEYTAGQLLWVDLLTGARTVFVDNDVVTNPFDVKYDVDDERAIIADSGLQAILSLNLGTGDVSTISSESVPEGGSNDLFNPWGIAIDDINDIALVLSDQGELGLWSSIKVIDLNSGERVTLTNPVCPDC